MAILAYPFPGYIHYVLAFVLGASCFVLGETKGLVKEFRSRGVSFIGFETSSLYSKLASRSFLVFCIMITNVILGISGKDCFLLWLALNVFFIWNTYSLSVTAKGIIIKRAREEADSEL